MENLLIKFAVILCVGVAAQEVKYFPEYLKDLRCHKSDPEFNKCVVDNFQKTMPYLIKGIPELGVPGIDPYVLPYFTFNRTIGNQMDVSGVIRNLVATGAGNAVIESFKSDPTKFKAETKVLVPWFNLSMEYDISGQFFGVPFTSEGFFEGTFNGKLKEIYVCPSKGTTSCERSTFRLMYSHPQANIRVYLKTSVQPVERNGIEFFKLEHIHTKLKIGDGHVQITTKDPSAQASANLITNYFNSNPSGTVEMAQRFMDSYPDDPMLKEMIDRQLSLIPASEILPD